MYADTDTETDTGANTDTMLILILRLRIDPGQSLTESRRQVSLHNKNIGAPLAFRWQLWYPESTCILIRKRKKFIRLK